MEFKRHVTIKCPYCGAKLVIRPALEQMADGVPSLCRCDSEEVETCGRLFVITISLNPVTYLSKIEEEKEAA